jgi:hypothetical protein
MQASPLATALNATDRQKAVPSTVSGSVRTAHAAVITPTLPLLARSWLQQRLVFGDNGTFETPQGAARGDRVAIDRPAASSAALLMRLPVDRRSIAVPSISLARMLAFWARKAEMLVLITDIGQTPDFRSASGSNRAAGCRAC